MWRKIDDIIWKTVLIIATLAIAGFLIYILYYELSAERKDVEINATISSVYYEPERSETYYDPSTKTCKTKTIEAEYHTYFVYEEWTIESDSQYVYSYAKSRINQKVKIKATQVTYKDKHIKYVFQKLIT